MVVWWCCRGAEGKKADQTPPAVTSWPPAPPQHPGAEGGRGAGTWPDHGNRRGDRELNTFATNWRYEDVQVCTRCHHIIFTMMASSLSLVCVTWCFCFPRIRNSWDFNFSKYVWCLLLSAAGDSIKTISWCAPRLYSHNRSGTGRRSGAGWCKRGDYEQPEHPADGSFYLVVAAADCWWRPQLVTLYTLTLLHTA